MAKSKQSLCEAGMERVLNFHAVAALRCPEAGPERPERLYWTNGPPQLQLAGPKLINQQRALDDASPEHVCAKTAACLNLSWFQKRSAKRRSHALRQARSSLVDTSRS